MLSEHLYSIRTLTYEGNRCVAALQLNRQSPVFAGHFPEMPVVPGVCSVRIIHELAERMVARELLMVRGDNIKFLGLINPDETPEIGVEMTVVYHDNGEVCVSAVITGSGKDLVKYAGCFR